MGRLLGGLFLGLIVIFSIPFFLDPNETPITMLRGVAFSVPPPVQNEAYFIKRIREYGHCGAYYGNLGGVPQQVMTPRICIESIKQSSGCFILSGCTTLTREVVTTFLAYGGNLQQVPEEYIDKEAVEIYINEGGSLRNVPKAHITPELALHAVQKQAENYEYVPIALRTAELTNIANIPYRPWLLHAVPDPQLTVTMIKAVLAIDGNQLEHVPPRFWSPSIFRIAVRDQGEVLKFVPFEYRTLELCRLALARGNEAFDYVPRRFFLPDENGKVSLNGVFAKR